MMPRRLHLQRAADERPAWQRLLPPGAGRAPGGLRAAIGRDGVTFQE